MKISRRNPVILPALALGFASVVLAPTSPRAAPGSMQVEEPVLGGPKPPVQPEIDQKAWTSKPQADLTDEQQASLKARQETMKDMVALIQKKRLAIRDARPEQREALALELHNLILEKGQAEHGSGQDVHLEVREARDKAADLKARRLDQKEAFLRQELHSPRESRRQDLEERKKLLEEKQKQTDERD